MTLQFLLATFSGFIILNSIFFGVLLLVDSKGLLRNKLLAFLLFGVALRTGKSILMLLFPFVPDSIPAIGLVGMGAIGPIMMFYSEELIYDRVVWNARCMIHFIFSMIMGVSLLFATDEVVFWLYFLTALQMAIYLGKTSTKILADSSRMETETFQWLKLLTASMWVMWSVYAIQLYFQGLVEYLTGTVVASLALLVVLFRAFKTQRIFIKSKKFARNEKNARLSEQILALMENDKLYKDSDLTMGKLAMRLQTKSYIISGILNEYHGKTFPEFINYYRIREAQQLLQSQQSKIYSIESIAFDCGFNTPSAFYTYFKKMTKLTPAEYRATKSGA